VRNAICVVSLRQRALALALFGVLVASGCAASKASNTDGIAGTDLTVRRFDRQVGSSAWIAGNRLVVGVDGAGAVHLDDTMLWVAREAGGRKFLAVEIVKLQDKYWLASPPQVAELLELASHTTPIRDVGKYDATLAMLASEQSRTESIRLLGGSFTAKLSNANRRFELNVRPGRTAYKVWPTADETTMVEADYPALVDLLASLART
jgi:hypothetical protein